MARRATLRLGIVGLGMGINHAIAALDLPEVELVAVAEPRPDRLERLAKRVADRPAGIRRQVDAIHRYDDWRTMVREAGLDAVSLALPTDLHYEATRDCLRAGLHVLCEKPPTTDAGQMRRLWREAGRRGLTYAFVRQQRFEPLKLQVRELVAAGALGTVTHAESHWLRSRGIPWREGWGVNAARGGGVLLDLGIHTVDDAWFCMGNPDPESVFCGMHCAFTHLAEGRSDLTVPYDADDHCVGLIRFRGGATLSTSASFAGNRVKADDLAPEEPRTIGNSEWLELGVYGNRAGVDLKRQRLVSHHRDGVQVKPIEPPKRLARMRTGFHGLIGDFAAAIAEGRPPLNDARQAVQLMRMLDALRRSATTGRSVSIPPLDG